MANFASVLDRPSSEVERPKPLPVGTYVWAILGLPKRDKSTKKGTEYVAFKVKALAARDDVDPEALEEYGGLKEVTRDLTFYTTEKSGYRLKEFLTETLEIDLETGTKDEKSLWEAAQETNGCQFLGTVTHEPSEDGKVVYDRITSTAVAE